MHLEGKFAVRAGQSEVYQFLTDPQTVSRHMPDVKETEFQDADHFTVKARVGISHIKGLMVMKLSITDRNPPVSTTVIGKGTGLASVVDMVTSFSLELGAGGQTIVNWRGDVNVAGKLAAFGPQGLLDRVGQQNVDRFIAGIKAGIDEAYGGPAAEVAAVPVATVAAPVTTASVAAAPVAATPAPALEARAPRRGIFSRLIAWLRALVGHPSAPATR
jgi:carbon monoxide dehydrogenase subunit G